MIETIDLQFQGHQGAIAAFLIDRRILIETGPESCRATLLAKLEERGLRPSDIEAVFVTHIHLDHAGGAGWWTQQGVPVYVHSKGARHLIDPSRLEESARQVYGERFDSLWGSLVPAVDSKVVSLKHGDTMDVSGIAVRAIETFGHCFHHHAYAIGDDLFVGDAAGAKLDDTGYLSVTSAPPQFHLEEKRNSLSRLKEEGAATLYLTHFGAVDCPDAHFDRYRDGLEQSARFIREKMQEKLDAESLKKAYEAFQVAESQACGVTQRVWETYQEINGTGMCADGIRLYWEKSAE